MGKSVNTFLRTLEPKKDFSYRLKRHFKIYDQNKYLILLFLPGLIWFIIFKYGPMYGLLMAFQDYSLIKGVSGSPWVGLKHFQYLFIAPDFLPALRNTIIISVYKILFGFPAPIILALILNEVRNQIFKRTIQTISYLPHFFFMGSVSWYGNDGTITVGRYSQSNYTAIRWKTYILYSRKTLV